MVGDKSDNRFFQFRMGKNYQQVNPEMSSLLDEALATIAARLRGSLFPDFAIDDLIHDAASSPR
jgi:hypothetical protein